MQEKVYHKILAKWEGKVTIPFYEIFPEWGEGTIRRLNVP